MLKLQSVHHVAIICSDYERSRNFYSHILGLQIIRENYRSERKSWKLDLALNENYIIELFSFPKPPARQSGPEACGLRHIAFAVSSIEDAVQWLNSNDVATEELRVDAYTGRKFTFFKDPDNLPIELYEQPHDLN